jgi:multisubunit Na+/H+ antiporter MnhC subunit
MQIFFFIVGYLGDPSEETNVCSVSSQIPRSAKYNKVENKTTQVTVKKNKADRASPDLLKAIIMTSIVITMAFEYL